MEGLGDGEGQVLFRYEVLYGLMRICGFGGNRNLKKGFLFSIWLRIVVLLFLQYFGAKSFDGTVIQMFAD